MKEAIHHHAACRGDARGREYLKQMLRAKSDQQPPCPARLRPLADNSCRPSCPTKAVLIARAAWVSWSGASWCINSGLVGRTVRSVSEVSSEAIQGCMEITQSRTPTPDPTRHASRPDCCVRVVCFVVTCWLSTALASAFEQLCCCAIYMLLVYS